MHESSVSKQTTYIAQSQQMNCFSFVSVHQMAPPLTRGSIHPVAAYYLPIDPEWMKG